MKKKSLAKAYGLKQIIVKGDDLYISQFEKGNDYKFVKLVRTDDQIQELAASNFDMESKSQQLTLLKALKNSDNNDKVAITNPLVSSKKDNKSKVKKEDYLMLKSRLEKMIFNKTFDDNVHIQIAYSILDIKKILSLYVFNILHSINNLCRLKEEDITAETDILGTLFYNRPLEEYHPKGHSDDNPKGFFLFNKFANQRLGYFPILLSKKEFEKSLFKNKYKTHEKYNFNCLRVLSFLRQDIIHDGDNSRFSLFEDVKLPTDLSEFVDDVFKVELDKINNSFEENAKKNLTIISRVMNRPIDEKLLDAYYKFSVIKDQKNIGINLVKLKENIYKILETDYSIRVIPTNKNDLHLAPKINLVYEYTLNDYFLTHPNLLESFIEELRKSQDEKDKDSIYEKWATKIIDDKKFKSYIISNVYSKVTAIVKAIALDKNVTLENLKLNKLSPNDFNKFSKIMFIISEFLDGKEKNELLTSLINKIDNIYLFKSILEKEEDFKEKVIFTKEYSLFANDNFVNQLRLIKNISKMTKIKDSVTKSLYIDALHSLGLFGKEIINNEIESMEKAPSRNHQFRNFIINNVIQSRRFHYISKYTDPSICSKIIRSEPLVSFVFNKLPDEQINKYYTSAIGKANVSIEEQKKQLIYKLKKFNFNSLKSSSKVIRDVKSIEREKLKALAGLYYTVCYLVVKSLVKVNSIYCIAFSVFERDNGILGDAFNSRNVKRDNYKDNCLDLLNHYLNIDRFYKTRTRDYLIRNKNTFIKFLDISSKRSFFKFIRNKTVHMEVIDKLGDFINDIKSVGSYFELYQFIFQSMLVKEFQEFEIDSELKKYCHIQNEDKSYSRNLLKMMYLPLAYNLGRYNNITIEDIFNSEYN